MSDMAPIKMMYTNWRGETAERLVVPQGAPWWGSTSFHQKECWLITMLDVEKDALRDFSLADCDFTHGKEEK